MLLLAGGGAATVLVVPPVQEQLVEGHTVFASIEVVKARSEEERFAAAVAILVQERIRKTSGARFPGVIWFNDQYLVDPTGSSGTGFQHRYPCTGAVIAVNRGDLIVDQDPDMQWTLLNPTYVESYLITDPNEHSWIVDLWNTTYGRPAWTVAIMNNQVGYGTPDNGKCSGPTYIEQICTPEDTIGGQRCVQNTAPVTNSDIDPRQKDPGDHGMRYPCQGCSPLRYNALLYFRLEHLDDPGLPKNHTEVTGDDWKTDATGCQPTHSNQWRCPGGDDDREGNSHPYNPDFPFVPYDGRNNHGGSDDCDGVIMYCHATRNVDIYYGYVARPLLRTFWLTDTAGADAPYHCHEANTLCAPGDLDDPVTNAQNERPTLPPP